MNRRPLSFYEFGPFRINVTERLLQHGDELVPLSPKVFDTLLILVENHGHVVEKRELMDQLWPDTFVEESSLTQNISLLRRALTSNDTDRQYIETIPKRGYRFIGDVNQLNESHDELTETSLVRDAQDRESVMLTQHRGRSRTNLYLAAIAVCVLLAVIAFGYRFKRRTATAGLAGKSIAVLPFKTIGTNGESELLGLGMADALIIRLSRLDELTVLPTGSVFRFTDQDKDAIAIGKQLGVDAVLDGTVQRQGDTVRVTAQLIRLSDGKTVWSAKYDERQSNIFVLQDSISEQLATSLIPELSASTKKTLWVKSTTNADAYQAYLMGVNFWNRRTKDNLAKAINYLEQAVAKDPEFALAHAILADCYFLSGTDEYRSRPIDEALARAESSADRALHIDDSIAEAHTVKACIHMNRRQTDEAGTEFRRAIELNPTYSVAHLRYAYFLMFGLRLEEGVSHMRRAQQLDPASPVPNAALGGILLTARQTDESIKYSQRALELEPTLMAARMNLGEAYLAKGMFKEGIQELAKLPQTDDEYLMMEKAYAYAVAGRREEALKGMAALQKQVGDKGAPYSYACIYAALGEKDKAFEWLEKINLNRVMLSSLKYDWQLDSLRKDARFNDFLKRHKLEYLLNDVR
ncbi:MAG TPA: winged helix-turn-helix domain-containing protein [Pyrinomonadaceae bacterium]|nr:winged helix-turn-helix domain-containing protein [Pyrinomonadaceae bacterium]